MLSRSFERKIRIFYLQLWPWRQFVYAVFASRDIARRTRAPAVEGKARDYAESAEERRRLKADGCYHFSKAMLFLEISIPENLGHKKYAALFVA